MKYTLTYILTNIIFCIEYFYFWNHKPALIDSVPAQQHVNTTLIRYGNCANSGLFIHGVDIAILEFISCYVYGNLTNVNNLIITRNLISLHSFDLSLCSFQWQQEHIHTPHSPMSLSDGTYVTPLTFQAGICWLVEMPVSRTIRWQQKADSVVLTGEYWT